MTLAGLPATTDHAFTSFVTTAHAPATAPSWIVIPGPTNTFAQTQAFDSIVIGLDVSVIAGSVMSWLAEHRNEYCETVAWSPIVILATL